MAPAVALIGELDIFQAGDPSNRSSWIKLKEAKAISTVERAVATMKIFSLETQDRQTKQPFGQLAQALDSAVATMNPPRGRDRGVSTGGFWAGAARPRGIRPSEIKGKVKVRSAAGALLRIGLQHDSLN